MLNQTGRYFCYCIVGVLFFASASAFASSERVGSAEDAVLRGLRGALSAISTPVDVALARAEYQFSLNGGADITPSAINLLTGAAANDYISALSICKKYFVKLTFQAARFNSGEISGTTTIPLPEAVFGKIIYLVPVAESGDSQITTFECMTNFTLANPIYQGDTGSGIDMDGTTDTATRSLLAKYTDHPILEKCIYLDSTAWATATATGVTGDC